jgi:hypothetical protein
MRMRLAVGMVTLAGLVSGARVSGAAFLYLDDARYVSADGGAPIGPAPGAAVFSQNAIGITGVGEQTSLLSTGDFSGNGTVITTDGVGLADSVFDVTFSVDVVTQFSLLGDFTDVSNAGAGARVGSFSDSTGSVTPLGGSFSVAGFLVPGIEYRVLVGIQSQVDTPGGNGGSWRVGILAYPVPEPRGVQLALLGLAAALGLARLRPRSG